MYWCNLVRELRAERGLSQRQAAIAASINRSTLRRLERCRASPKISVLERLLTLYGYELDAVKSN
jgi:transcriptional regulator with XRE-family HTH domain